MERERQKKLKKKEGRKVGRKGGKERKGKEGGKEGREKGGTLTIKLVVGKLLHLFGTWADPADTKVG